MQFSMQELVMTHDFILFFEPTPVFGKGIAKLTAWASLLSIARIRRNAKIPNFISLVFKAAEERQPWVCNIQVTNHETFLSNLLDLL